MLELPNEVTAFGSLQSTPWTTASASAAFTAAQVTAAYVNMAKVYDFYANLHQDSFDNNGSTIKIILNGRCKDEETSNACWNWMTSGMQRLEGIFVGAGWRSALSALDVMGHEFTHGVISYIVREEGAEAGGFSSNAQSQALNEAYADIMGSLIENKSGRDRWRFGEDMDAADLIKLGQVGAIRDMSRPAFYSGRTTGQPHRDSVYFSHAAYLMMSHTRNISSDVWARVFTIPCINLMRMPVFLTPGVPY